MWTWKQSTGEMLAPDGSLLAEGYSGAWDGALPVGGPTDHRNRSADQEIVKHGPIPVGNYVIGEAITDPLRGPIAMHLTPDPSNQMFGRSAFMIHGDLSPPRSGQASEGCIILNRTARLAIADADDADLVVV